MSDVDMEKAQLCRVSDSPRAIHGPTYSQLMAFAEDYKKGMSQTALAHKYRQNARTTRLWIQDLFVAQNATQNVFTLHKTQHT